MAEVAETPAGQRYTVVTAPPGSALDAGGRFGTGGVVAGLVAVGMVVARSARRGGRIAVTPCDGQGRPTGSTHNASPISRPPMPVRLLSCLRFGAAVGPSRRLYPPVGDGRFLHAPATGPCARRVRRRLRASGRPPPSRISTAAMATALSKGYPAPDASGD